MTKFSLATSWNTELVSQIALANRLQAGVCIDEFYGSYAISLAGSARPSGRLPSVSGETVRAFLQAAAKSNIRFNWVMNAPDLQGCEADAGWIAGVRRELEQVCEMGVGAITVAHPTLIREVRDHFPSLSIKVSLVAGVDTVDKAKEFEDLGVACICLNPHTVNRDFDRLHAIRSSVRCALELYANIPCLQDCPYRNEHYRFLGHSSQAMGVTLPFGVDPFFARCSLDYLDDPQRILASPFIRPEDIKAYSEMGIDRFKLTDRCASTDFLVTTARAYLSGLFEGDLFALIFRGGSKFLVAMGGGGKRQSYFSSDTDRQLRADPSRLPAQNHVIIKN